MKRRALLPLLLVAPGWAWAQSRTQQSAPIYRCGPDGRQLSDRPCADGSPGAPQRYTEPSSAEREAARERAERDAKQARQMQKQREAFERQPSPAPQRLSAAPAPAEPAPKNEAYKVKRSKPKKAQPKKSGKPSP